MESRLFRSISLSSQLVGSGHGKGFEWAEILMYWFPQIEADKVWGRGLPFAEAF